MSDTDSIEVLPGQMSIFDVIEETPDCGVPSMTDDVAGECEEPVGKEAPEQIPGQMTFLRHLGK